MKNLLYLCLISVLTAAACLAGFSCSSGSTPHVLEGSDAEALEFLGGGMVAPDEADFTFSKPVQVVSLSFDPPQGETRAVSEENIVKVFFSTPPETGAKITADLVVEDEEKNTLNVLIPFRGRNDEVPPLVINELRTEYSKPKAEFVELKALGDGNLGALRLFIAGVSLTEPVYEFPAAEVKAGDYIVLHLRTLDGGTDETGDDLALSGGTEASDEARDLWIDGNTERLRKSDAVWLVDQDDTILDAVIFSEKSDAWGTTKAMAAALPQAAEVLAAQGAWVFPEAGESFAPGDAASSAGSTTAKTISRREDQPDGNARADWYLASATPGAANTAEGTGSGSATGQEEGETPAGGGSGAAAPVFLGCHVVSLGEVDFTFSKPVEVVSCSFDPPQAGAQAVSEGNTVKVSFPTIPEAGVVITAHLQVKDEAGKSLTLQMPFMTQNSGTPPWIVINEVRTEYKSPTAEFVELKALEDGNMGALRLFIAGVSLTEPVYEFPAVEVKAGDYIVLHLRTLDGGTDETGDDLALSGGTDASDTARDLWVAGTAERLRKSDAVWLVDQSGVILDAVIFSEKSDAWGTTKAMAAALPQAAGILAAQGAWVFPEAGDSFAPSDAASSAGSTTAKTISRRESQTDGNSKADWYLAASATPGKANQ